MLNLSETPSPANAQRMLRLGIVLLVVAVLGLTAAVPLITDIGFDGWGARFSGCSLYLPLLAWASSFAHALLDGVGLSSFCWSEGRAFGSVGNYWSGSRPMLHGPLISRFGLQTRWQPHSYSPG